MADTNGLDLTAAQAQQIVRKCLASHEQSTVKLLKEIRNEGYSYTPNTKTYILDLAAPGGENAPCSCFITISAPGGSNSSHYRANSLPLIYQLITQIRTHTSIPIPNSFLSISLDIVPFHFLLSPASPIASSDIISLSVARQSGLLSTQANLLIDLQIGRYLGQLHSGVQNDWFGVPALQEPQEPSYSWQETFTSVLDGFLSEFEAEALVLPYEDIRRYLSRAIGSFLFDDVDTPSLIWFTGSEDDIYISLPSHPATKALTITAILPNVSHALWGDPLLESFFLPPGPSTAITEGYTGSGGGPLTIFPRQRTKRIWYTLFLAVLILKERQRVSTASDGPRPKLDRQWALESIAKCVELLRDAPCY